MEWISTRDLLRGLGVPDDLISIPGDVCRAIRKRARVGMMRATAAMICTDDSCERDAEVPKQFWASVPEQDWERGDFTAWIKVKCGGMYPKEREVQVKAFGVRFAKDDAEAMGADFASGGSSATADEEVVSDGQPGTLPHKPDETRIRKLAAAFDLAGIPKREVKAPMIADKWQSDWGPRPTKENVWSEMAGRPKGRTRKTAQLK